MNKNRMILSAIGILAIIVPAVLLIVFTSKEQTEPTTDSNRQIDPTTVEDVVNKGPKVTFSPQPTPATASATPTTSSPSAF